MTRAEFNQWWTHFATAFPAAGDFVCKDGKQGVEALKLWFGVLEKCELADALAVTNGMFEGVLQAIPGTEKGYPDWSQTPRHVRRLCAEMHPVVPEWKKETFRDRSKKSLIDRDPIMARTFRESLRILDDGGTMADVRSMLDAEFGVASRAQGHPRHVAAFDAFNASDEF